MSIKIFISSNHEEFSEERRYIKEELEKDPSFKDFIDVFVFEKAKSLPISPVETFINAVRDADVYIGILGSDYGSIKENGLSSTEYEYQIYNSFGHNAYFFVKKVKDRDENVKKFIRNIISNKTCQMFETKEELLAEIKKSLHDYISKKLNYTEFDEKIIRDSSFEDVDEESYNLLFDVLENDSLLRFKNYRQAENILSTLNVGEIDFDGNFCLNNTGALFFAKDIDKFDINHEVKMVRFNGNSKLEIIDKLFSKSPIFVLLNEFEQFFMKNTKMASKIKGIKRINIPEYPIEAVREAMINALAHRDYNMKGSFIQFYIYDDRIEIISPGRLPYPLTPEDLKDIEMPVHRNKRICDLFSKTVYMEHIGSGIFRMYDAMLKSGLPEPEFIEGDNYFKVILRGPNGQLIYDENDEDMGEDLKQLGLNDRQIESLSRMVNDNESFTYVSYAKEFNVSESTAKRDLKDLLKHDLIVQINKNKKNYFSSK